MASDLPVLLRAIHGNPGRHLPGIRARCRGEPAPLMMPVCIEAKNGLGSWEKLLEAVEYAEVKGLGAALEKYIPKKAENVVEWNGKTSGHVVKDGRLFRMIRRLDRHRCLKYDAIGLQLDVLVDLEGRGVEEVLLILSDVGRRYRLPLVKWFEEGVEDTLNPVDGKQVFISMERLAKYQEGQHD